MGDLKRKMLTCIFCDEACESLERLKAHSAACGRHPLAAEVARLRALLEEYADHAADSGWHNLAAEIRRLADG